MKIYDRFEAVSKEHYEFNRIENKRSERPDLHAFLLLDELFPYPGVDMVSCAEHDTIWLEPGGDKLSALTDDQILELVRCGVGYDDETESISFMV